MSDLFDPQVRGQFRDRLLHLEPDAQAKWGSLTAPRMVAHLIDAFEIGFGEKAVTVRGPLANPIGRWLVLRMPIPRGKLKAPPEFHECEPGEFAADRDRVLAYLDRFAAGPEQQWGPSPFLGRMSGQQWARLHAKHLEHHLTQFGV